MDLDKRRMQLYILLGPNVTNAVPEYHVDNMERFIRDFDYDHLHFMQRIRDHIVNIVKSKGPEAAAAETRFPGRVCRSMDPDSKQRKALWFHSEPRPKKIIKTEGHAD